jgi:type IV pilus assembly protein PilY1
MKSKLSAFARPSPRSLAQTFALVCAGMLSVSTQGASTDLADAPLSLSQRNSPNLMFILDDSGSMSWSYMPDAVDDLDSNAQGRRSSQCNGVAYDPTIQYALPKNALGVSYPAVSLAKALGDGFKPTLKSASPTPVTSSTSVTMASGASNAFVVSATTGFSITAGASGNDVIVRNPDSPSQWMKGTVTAINSSTKTLTISINFSTADASISNANWQIGVANTSDLSTTSTYYYTYKLSSGASGYQAPLSWTYTNSGAAVTSSTFYTQCNTSSGNEFFTLVYPKDLSTDSAVTNSQSNYATWYSYYRTRRMSMRSAAGNVFSDLRDKGFRVGFSLISDTTAVTGTNYFLPAETFDSTHALKFFTSLYEPEGSGSTPLRGALSKMGRYYGNKAPGQAGNLVSGQTTPTPDPVQNTCQRNYTMLSTDGYWNTGGESSTYGPFKLDGITKVGQQDGLDSRPQYDGSTTTTTIIYKVGQSSTSTSSQTKVEVSFPKGDKVVLSACSRSGFFFYTYTCTATKTPGYSYTKTTTTGTREVTTKDEQTETLTYTNAKLTSDKITPTTPVRTNTPVDTWNTPTVTPETTWVATGAATTSTYSCFGGGSACSANGVTLVNGTYYLTGPGTNAPTAASLGAGTTYGTASTSSWTPFKTYVSTSSTTTGGPVDTLADIAEYYYVTPFRTAPDVNCLLTPNSSHCNTEMTGSDSDPAKYQHMTTYTLGLGLNGKFKYTADYATASSGDYFDVKRGKNSSGTVVNWPDPTSNDPARIDDLWHAAVNGRGKYFSAGNPTAVTQSISTMLNQIGAMNGYGGSAAASSLKPLMGEDAVYLASFSSEQWSGELTAKLLEKDSTTGALKVGAELWNASTALDAMAFTDRVIKFASGTTSKTLTDFNYSNLQNSSLSGSFDNLCGTGSLVQQCSSLTSTVKAIANNGTNLVNYIRGERTHEKSDADAGKAFRGRKTRLGDIVHASPVFVGQPPFLYSDTGYSEFKSSKASRAKTVYLASNDGMLHAISGEGESAGAERWAFIPTAVIPNLPKLADTAFDSNHKYILDGAPVVADIKDDTLGWRTILVGGLGKGGKGYYALDITDPTAPSYLWEYSNTNDADMGYSFGPPIVTKIKDQSSTEDKWIWAVLLTSGYNNNSGGGSGVGALYILNANTGALIRKIQTTVPNPSNSAQDQVVGSTTTPNGLAKINAYVESDTDNRALRVYGTDLEGHLWRFDINGTYEPKNKSLLLAKFATTSSSGIQSIMTRPELAEVIYGTTRYPVVVVGTGRYLGKTDLDTLASPYANTNSIYAIKDPLTSTGWGLVRSDHANIVKQTLSDSSDGTFRTFANSQSVDWGTKMGWAVDLPGSKERVALDLAMQYGVVGIASHDLQGTSCSTSGKSWIYFLDVMTGAGVKDGDAAGQPLGGLATGITWMDLGHGDSIVLLPTENKRTETVTPGKKPPGKSGKATRTSWRELIN